MTDRLKVHILQVEDMTEPQKIAAFVKSMRAQDSRMLRKYIDEITPTIDMTQEYECPECGEVREVGVPLTPEFFWPSG